MVAVTFKCADGSEHQVDCDPGYSVMEAAYNNGVPGIEAVCGGAAACATCHVYVDPVWLGRIGEMRDNEDAMLFMANDRRSNSRLSCQIPISDDIDGLIVKVADNEF